MRRWVSILLTGVMVVGMISHNTVDVVASKAKNPIIEEMTVEQKLAQMIMPSLRSWNGTDITALNPELVKVFGKYDFGGVILFGQNTKDATQTTELINSIQVAHESGGFKYDMFIAVDQEGGRVTRLQTGTNMPGNMAVAATGDASNAYKTASVIGEELAVQGFNLDFAPVVDVNSNPANPVIGVRSFSEDPNVVTKFGKSYMMGLHYQNVMSCLKHFPGHGDTDVDSHTGLPVVNKSYEEMKKTELVPYAALAKSADFIMTAHIQYPQIEKETCISKSSGQNIYLPATLSKKFLTDILRGDLGYKGLIITDSMEMDAITVNFDKLDASARAINAGADMLLMPVRLTSEADINNLDAYIKGLAAKVESGEISESRLNESVNRIMKIKDKYGLYNGKVRASGEKAASVVGSKEHKAVEWDIALVAVKGMKNEDVYPISKDKKVVIFYHDEAQLSSIKAGAEKAGANEIKYVSYEKGVGANADTAIRDADVVVCISTCSTGKEIKENTKVKTLLQKAKTCRKMTLVLSTNLPYDLEGLNDADALVACYGPGINVTAAIYKLF
ncbi:MAG: hypothetical protein IKO84_05425 [Butyrivibrio sp.]|nr:hypothetical protein [Butyrivibrio sp.]